MTNPAINELPTVSIDAPNLQHDKYIEDLYDLIQGRLKRIWATMDSNAQREIEDGLIWLNTHADTLNPKAQEFVNTTTKLTYIAWKELQGEKITQEEYVKITAWREHSLDERARILYERILLSTATPNERNEYLSIRGCRLPRY